MSGGVLEVLLVNAEGLKHARLPGSTSHVIIECGVHTVASKFTADDNGKARWNEKFSFKLSHLDLEKLTRIKLWIIRQDKFFEDYHIGEATIHLMDILKEGIRRGSIELKPAPYNVVLEDRTFKGEIKVGLRFISDAKEVQFVDTRCRLPEKQSESLYETILNLTLRWIFWPRFFFYFIMNRSAKSSTESKKTI